LVDAVLSYRVARRARQGAPACRQRSE
jgi:hypothetical protein